MTVSDRRTSGSAAGDTRPDTDDSVVRGARRHTDDESERMQARAVGRGARRAHRADADGASGAEQADTDQPDTDQPDTAKSDTDKPATATPDTDKSGPEKTGGAAKSDKESGRGIGTQVSEGVTAVRNRVASVVWLIAVLCALVLAVGALLAALRDTTNNGNPIVAFINDTARTLDGPFGSIFSFDGKDGRTKEILVNWGLAALAYLVAGRILDRIIRP